MTDWRARVRDALPAVTGDPRRDAEIRDELVQHCADRVDDLVRDGLPRVDAEARTLDELTALARRPGDLARAGARLDAAATPTRSLSSVWRWLRADLPAAARALRRAPALALVSWVTVALAVATATVAFAVVRGVLLRPLPFPAPDRLVAVWEVSPTGNTRNPVASGNVVDWTARARGFDGLAALQGPFDRVLTGAGDPERVRGVMATASLDDVLGIAPARGRLFSPADGEAGPLIVVATHRFWTRRLGARDDLIGRPLQLGGRPYELIGVLPPSAAALLDDVDVVFPVRWSDAARDERRSHNYAVIARLAADVSLEIARAEMDTIVAALTREHPQALTNWGVSVVALHDDLVREVRPLLTLILAVVILVAGVACANLGNLQVARSARRAGEMAVRAALGASRGRLAAFVTLEAALIAGIGGAAGVALAAAALPSLLALSPIDLPRLEAVAIDALVVGVAAAVAAVCGAAMMLGAALPAWRHGSMPIADAASTRVSGGRQRLRHAAIAAQVALSLVLLVAAALLTQSLLRVRAVDHGFAPERLLAVRLDLPRARYPDGPSHVEFYSRVIERLGHAPGVVDAAGTTGQPAVSAPMTFSFAIFGRPSPNPTGREHPVPLQAVTSGYFETMRIPVHRGRAFTAADRAGRPGVVIVNEALARLHWPDASPVGQRLSFRPGELPWLEIVGVVGDTRDDGLDQEAPPTIYVPFAQKPESWAWMTWQTLVVRTEDDPSAVVPAVRAIVRDIDPSLAVLEATPMASWFAMQGAPRRFAVQLTVAFAALAVLLGAIGIHGVLAYTVSARRRDIAIRQALGASRPQLLSSVVRTTLAFTVVGLAAGLVVAANVTPFLETLLYGVAPTDPATFAGIALLVLAVAAVAAWLPARRALGVSAATELRR